MIVFYIKNILNQNKNIIILFYIFYYKNMIIVFLNFITNKKLIKGRYIVRIKLKRKKKLSPILSYDHHNNYQENLVFRCLNIFHC